MQTVTGKSTTVKSASNGTPIVTSGAALTPGSGWQNAGNFGVAQGASGAINVAGKGNVNVNGKAVPVQVNGSVSKGDIASAVISCATGGIVGCGIAVIPLGAAWLASSGTRVNPQTGALETTGNGTIACTVGPCYWWVYQAEQFRTQDAACKAYAIKDTASWNGAKTTTASAGATISSCHIRRLLANGAVDPDLPEGDYGVGVSRGGSRPPDSPTWYPTTSEEAKAQLIKSNPVPGVVTELAKAGASPEQMPLGITGITGPASIAGATTTTVNNIDNSVKTSTTTNTYNYAGNTVTNTGATTTTTTTNAQGQTTESSTSTMNPGADAPAEEAKETQCDKFPNSLGCAELDTPTGQIPRDSKSVTFQAEDLLGTGQCPADVMTTLNTLGGRSVKVVDWQTFCGMAVPLRALVMGLAAIMAFFIIMPGGVRE